jgi:predicted RNA-binding protein with RPS1 domain
MYSVFHMPKKQQMNPKPATKERGKKFSNTELDGLPDYSTPATFAIPLDQFVALLNAGDFAAAIAYLEKFSADPKAIEQLSKEVVISAKIMQSSCKINTQDLQTSESNKIILKPVRGTFNDKDLNQYGFTNQPDKILQCANVKLVEAKEYTKTTLFKTIIKMGAYSVAMKMMEIIPEGQFNYNDDPYSSSPVSMCIKKMRSLQGDLTQVTQLAQILVSRKDFSLAGRDVDKKNNKSVAIIERIVMMDKPELLLEHMTHADLSSLIRVFCWPSFTHLTPLMYLAYLGKTSSVKLLLSRNVDLKVEAIPSQEQLKQAREVKLHVTEERSISLMSLINAASFAPNNKEILILLLKAGCTLPSLFVGEGNWDEKLGMDFRDFAYKIIDLAQELGFLQETSDFKKFDNIQEVKEHFAQLLAKKKVLKTSTKKVSKKHKKKEKAVTTSRVEELEDVVVVDEEVKADVLDAEEALPEMAVAETQETASEDEVSSSGDSDESSGIDLETLLLEYYAAQDEDQADIAQQIKELCEDSAEDVMQFMSSQGHGSIELGNITIYIDSLLSGPKALHEYFQARKASVQETLENIAKVNADKAWRLSDKEVISRDDAIPVETKMHNRLFVKIADAFKDLVQTGLDHLKILARDSHGQNGIKFMFDKGIATLKTIGSGDVRLIAKGMHRNDDGDLLLYFNESTNHAGIDNMGTALIGSDEGE